MAKEAPLEAPEEVLEEVLEVLEVLRVTAGRNNQVPNEKIKMRMRQIKRVAHGSSGTSSLLMEMK